MQKLPLLHKHARAHTHLPQSFSHTNMHEYIHTPPSIILFHINLHEYIQLPHSLSHKPAWVHTCTTPPVTLSTYTQLPQSFSSTQTYMRKHTQLPQSLSHKPAWVQSNIHTTPSITLSHKHAWVHACTYTRAQSICSYPSHPQITSEHVTSADRRREKNEAQLFTNSNSLGSHIALDAVLCTPV